MTSVVYDPPVSPKANHLNRFQRFSADPILDYRIVRYYRIVRRYIKLWRCPLLGYEESPYQIITRCNTEGRKGTDKPRRLL